MSDNLERSQFWLERIARFICGGLVGVFVGLGWMFYCPIDGNATLNWGILIAAVVICGVLATRFGDDFWTRILPWID